MSNGYLGGRRVVGGMWSAAACLVNGGWEMTVGICPAGGRGGVEGSLSPAPSGHLYFHAPPPTPTPATIHCGDVVLITQRGALPQRSAPLMKCGEVELSSFMPARRFDISIILSWRLACLGGVCRKHSALKSEPVLNHIEKAKLME